jgi:hypothetical protein
MQARPVPTKKRSAVLLSSTHSVSRTLCSWRTWRIKQSKHYQQERMQQSVVVNAQVMAHSQANLHCTHTGTNE